jgi:ribosome maturation factor RimP
VTEHAAFDRELEERVAALGFELVECKHGGSSRRPHFTVRIDRQNAGSDTRLTVDDCAVLSRALEAWLDQAEAGRGGRYILEVSSPGLDRPLKTAAAWRRFLGKPVDVLVPALGGRFRVTAHDVLDTEAAVDLEFPKGVRRIVPLADIKEARLGFDW